MKKIIGIILVIIENIYLLYGIFYLGWNIYFIFVVFCFQWLLATMFTFIKIWKKGGGDYLYRKLDLDKEHYAKMKITDNVNASPFVIYMLSQIIWNIFLVVYMVGAISKFEMKFDIIFIIILINSVVYFLTVQLKTEKELIKFLARPSVNFMFIFFVAAIGFGFYELIGSVILAPFGLVLANMTVQILAYTNLAHHFYKSILSSFSINFK